MTDARTALVVDDERELGESLADLLGLVGYAATVCGGGEAAKPLLASRDWDLVVSDLRMPGTDGPALFAWLAAARPALVGTVAFSTGDTLSPGAARFLLDSGRPYMEKPFTLAAVRTMVAAVQQGVGDDG